MGNANPRSQSEKYDVILGSMAITEERLKAVNFSNPYYRSGAQIFVAKKNTSISSPEDLKGKKIGVVKASTFKTLLQNIQIKLQNTIAILLHLWT